MKSIHLVHVLCLMITYMETERKLSIPLSTIGYYV